ncbi:MMP7 protein, partial [Acromyrmex insinuator]
MFRYFCIRLTEIKTINVRVSIHRKIFSNSILIITSHIIYQFCGPGTRLAKSLARGDRGLSALGSFIGGAASVVNDKDNDDDEYIFDDDDGNDSTRTEEMILRANENTMRSEIKCAYRIYFIETHTYNPYANTTFGYSDKIRIPIQQDLYTLPCESFLYVEGKFSTKKRDGNTSEQQPPKLSNNCIEFMFDEIRYEIDGVEIDRFRNVGITSTIKNFISLTSNKSIMLENAGWDGTMHLFHTTLSDDFNFCVPLNTLLGFCEDYKRIVINARHELILIRARNDNNCVVAHESVEPKITLSKIQWKMPHVVLNDVNKLELFLNSDFYPYDDMNLDFKYAVLYDMYVKFQKSYYGHNNRDAMLSIGEFLIHGPFIVIDCSRQNESIKSATVDIRIEFECKENIPLNTCTLKTTAFAFSLWAANSSLSFQRKTLNPDILISYCSGTHTYADRKRNKEICSSSFDGPSGIFAHAFYPSNVVNYTAEIHVDSTEQWHIHLTEKSAYLLNTLTHEIGHALGLMHSSREDSIMFAFVTANNKIVK